MNPERLQRMDDIAEAQAEYANRLAELGYVEEKPEPKPKEVQ
jgi:hypothetical protein